MRRLTVSVVNEHRHHRVDQLTVFPALPSNALSNRGIRCDRRSAGGAMAAQLELEPDRRRHCVAKPCGERRGADSFRRADWERSCLVGRSMGTLFEQPGFGSRDFKRLFQLQRPRLWKHWSRNGQQNVCSDPACSRSLSCLPAGKWCDKGQHSRSSAEKDIAGSETDTFGSYCQSCSVGDPEMHPLP